MGHGRTPAAVTWLIGLPSLTAMVHLRKRLRLFRSMHTRLACYHAAKQLRGFPSPPNSMHFFIPLGWCRWSLGVSGDPKEEGWAKRRRSLQPPSHPRPAFPKPASAPPSPATLRCIAGYGQGNQAF